MKQSNARIYLKRETDVKLYCWAEAPTKSGDFVEVGECKALLSGRELLVDHIVVYPQFRGQGHARAIIEKLRTLGFPLHPMGVLPGAESFWDLMTPGWRLKTSHSGTRP